MVGIRMRARDINIKVPQFALMGIISTYAWVLIGRNSDPRQRKGPFSLIVY